MWKRISVVLSVATIVIAGGTTASAQNPTSGQQQPQAAVQLRARPALINMPCKMRKQRAKCASRTHVSWRAVSSRCPRPWQASYRRLFRKSLAARVLIREVLPNSPAAKAGIKPYDIVTEVNKQPVHSAEHLMSMIVARDRPGKNRAASSFVIRKSENLNVTLGERPIIRGQEPEGSETAQARKRRQPRRQPGTDCQRRSRTGVLRLDVAPADGQGPIQS